jgi:hypothetical protein
VKLLSLERIAETWELAAAVIFKALVCFRISSPERELAGAGLASAGCLPPILNLDRDDPKSS